jgi:hypothetical protein
MQLLCPPRQSHACRFDKRWRRFGVALRRDARARVKQPDSLSNACSCAAAKSNSRLADPGLLRGCRSGEGRRDALLTTDKPSQLALGVRAAGEGKAGRLTYVGRPSRLAPGALQREKVRRDALLP